MADKRYNPIQLQRILAAAKEAQRAAQALVEALEAPALVDSCPGTGEAHQWGQIDRHTDGCLFCAAMRPHQKRRG